MSTFNINTFSEPEGKVLELGVKSYASLGVFIYALRIV